MKLVSNRRTVHKRNSVRALIVGTAISFAGSVWAALPGALVDRLPMWLIFAVPCAISAFGLIGAYTAQSSLEKNNVDAE